jgi:hypothetical protein
VRSLTKSTAALAAITITVGAGLVGLAGRADAKQNLLPITCDGQQHFTVRVNSSNSGPNGGWSVGQIVDGGTGHGIPTKISGTVVDTLHPEAQFTFEQLKGRGNANQNQPTINCDTEPQSGKLGDFIDPGTTLPPNVSLDDPATFTITVTVVRQP